MIKQMLPLVLLLSACEGQAPTDSSSAAFSTRDPISIDATIIQWQAINDTQVYILDSGHTLHYGDGTNWQTVQTNVGWFGAQRYGTALWLKDLQNNLYQWKLGASPTGVAASPIASGVGQAKVASDGTPYWVANGYLTSLLDFDGVSHGRIDSNLQGFFPDSSEFVFDIGDDGKLWGWGWNGSAWVRTYMDGSAAAAQPGCFANEPNGVCHSYVLGDDRKLWLESNETGGHGSNDVDGNVYAFYGMSGTIVFVAGEDKNLWREDGSYQHRDFVDGNVESFQPTSNVTAWVQGFDGKLWREHLSPTLP